MEDGKEYTYREPAQKPINPPYKSALAIKRGQGGATSNDSENDTSAVEDIISTMSLETNEINNSDKWISTAYLMRLKVYNFVLANFSWAL